MRSSLSCQLSAVSYQLALFHRRDAETPRKNQFGNLRALPIRKDDEAASLLLSAFLLFLLCVSASRRLNLSLSSARHNEFHRRDAEAQRKPLIGNLRALCPLCALPIPKDDAEASLLLTTFLVFLLCVSASRRLNPPPQEARYAH